MLYSNVNMHELHVQYLHAFLTQRLRKYMYMGCT